MIKINQENLYFSEPLLEMGAVNRFFVRLAIYCFYAVLAVAAAIFLLSDIGRLFWAGVLLSLFLGDRLLHFSQAERSLFDLNGGKEQKINIADYLTPVAFKALEKAFEKSVFVGANFYLYLAKFLTENRDVNEALLRMDVDIDRLAEKTEDFLKNQPSPPKTKKDLTGQAEILLKKAFELALVSGERYIEPRHIFSSLSFIEDQEIKRLFNLFSVNPADLENAIVFGRFRRNFYRFSWLRLPRVLGGFAAKHDKIRHRIMNRAWTSRPTPILDKYGIDFTDLARSREIGFLIGHRLEYERTVDVLSKPGVKNIMLVGEPGSGKETIVAHLAYEIAKDKVPEPLFDKRVVSLKIGSLISGASADEVSKRINGIMDEILAAGNIVLYIPDIHNLTKTSGNHYLSAADIMIPIITTDAFPVIGATYPREFKEMVETRSDFSNAFEVVRVEEINEDEAVRLLTYESIILEPSYGVMVSFGAVKTAVALAHKYFRHKLLPASAEELLKESLADASQNNKKILKSDDVINIAERKTNVPIHRAGKKEVEKLLNLENIIHQRLVDQEEAVKAVSQSLREYRSGLSRDGGPIAAFLFVGPTGVGKTELSKILARIQFGSEKLMARFDMSEYQTKESINRFIGSSDGKIAGSLTEAIIQRPYSLILLDEFEKAHPDILNLFLQVFDDGRLTDALGRTVDFSNTIIISTSNAHSDFIKTHIDAGTAMETIADELKKKLTQYFKPELLNRFSRIIVFKNLSPENIKAIAALQLKDLERVVGEGHGIVLEFSDEVVGRVAELGYDPAFGARPLRGVISDKIKSVLAEKILKSEIINGSSVKIILENGEIKFI